MRKSFPALLIVSVALLLAGSAALAFRATIRDAVWAMTRPQLPPAKPYPAVSRQPSAISPKPQTTTASTTGSAPSNLKPQASNLPKEVNLAVPFTPQAPHADWSMPYQEACEEASLIMVNAYLAGVSSFTPDEADRQILKMVEWEKGAFGYYEDTTAEETARVAREYYGYGKAKAVPISSIEDVKREIAKGNPVILPAAGRLLGNPYFRGQGPRYHMLVAKGYTRDGKIITNDPGTKRGADFLYDPKTLWNAVHDWNGGDVASGSKMMIVVEK